jgi:hypothetical protein
MDQKNALQTKYQLDRRPERKCVICESKLVGRSDKVFCGIQCKNKYHSDVRKSNKTFESETLKTITKNYYILAGAVNQENSASVKKLVLQRLGFNFDHVTHIQIKPAGIIYSVFEFSFYISKNGNVIIHKDSKQIPISPYLYKRWKAVFPENLIQNDNTNKTPINANFTTNYANNSHHSKNKFRI